MAQKWNEEELNIMYEYYEQLNNDDMEKLIPNRTRLQIIDKAMKMGLKKNHTFKKYNQEDVVNKLLEFAKNIKRTPLLSEIRHFDWCPSSMSMYRYFGGYRELCKLCDLEMNTNVFGSSHPFYKSKNNDLCWSKSELVITNYFIDNKIPYRREVLYSDFINDERCGTKNCDWIIGENTFVEYFGLHMKDFYKIKMDLKIKICEENNIKLISITDRYVKDLDKIFKEYLPKLTKSVETKYCNSNVMVTPIS